MHTAYERYKPLFDKVFVCDNPCPYTALYAICIQQMADDRPGRGKARQWTLRPQDLATAFKLLILGPERVSYAALAEALYLSVFEAHAAAMRLVTARLAVEDQEGVVRPTLNTFVPFVLHGAPYAFPPVRGGVTIGFPTVYGVQPLSDMMLFSDQIPPPVWPHPEGPARGPALLPLYPKLPLAARDDAQLYRILSLFDALRIGQARERKIAIELLSKRLSP